MDNTNRYDYEDIAYPEGRFPERPRRKKGGLWFAAGILTGLVCALVIGGVVMAFTGGSSGVGKSGSSSTFDKETLEKLGILEQYIDAYYLDADSVTVEQKRDGLYKGLFTALGDPYSVYYTAEEMEHMQEDLEGVFYGIGAYLTLDQVTGIPMISGVIKDSPAEAAGLMGGDIIYKVDDEDVTSMSLDEVVSRVRGPEGTNVHLTIYRENEQLEFDITRAKVNSPSVESWVLGTEEEAIPLPADVSNYKIGYLQITEFNTVTTEQFRENMTSLRDQGIQGLVLDLRGNPGGSVDTVCKVAEDFLPAGLIFYMEDSQGRRTEYKCKGAGFDLPLVVLVDGNSASAAEILAGGIKDSGVGLLLGTQTFGKGIVQNLVPLPDGTGFKLTTSAYFTRGGNNIHKVGIEPDEVLEFDSDAYKEDKSDNQLYRAAEIVINKIRGAE